jgi:hypothetical protein
MSGKTTVRVVCQEVVGKTSSGNVIVCARHYPTTLSGWKQKKNVCPACGGSKAQRLVESA